MLRFDLNTSQFVCAYCLFFPILTRGYDIDFVVVDVGLVESLTPWLYGALFESLMVLSHFG